MRALIFSLIAVILVLPGTVFSQTYIAGSYGDAIWTIAGSPYIVTGTAFFETLTIEPGVEVYFDAYAELRIEENIAINGTPEDSVIIRNGATHWEEIWLGTTSGAWFLLHDINYTIFEGGDNSGWHGIIYCERGDLSFRNCTFRNMNGTVINMNGQIVNVLDCDFYNNSSNINMVRSGDHDNAIIRDCRFYNNNCSNGIIYLRCYWNPVDRTAVVSNCEFYNNVCDFCLSLENGTVSNSVFYETTSTGQPVFQPFTSPPIEYPCYIQNCIVWGCDSVAYDTEMIDIQYSDIEVPFPGVGNISIDPMFCDPANGDFSLLPGSPCIDAGNPGGFWYDDNGTRADMGKDGGSGFVPIPTQIEFPPAYFGEEMSLPFYFYNLNDFDAEILSTYFTSPENFSFELDSASTLLSPLERAKYVVTFTCPGYEQSTDMVVVSPQFIAEDTASVHLHGMPVEYTPVSGVWTVENSPYIYYDNIIVPDGEQLVIEPGVTVKIAYDKVFKIEGNLQALGAEGDSILLMQVYDPWVASWGGLWFNEADGENLLKYVKIWNATGCGGNGYNGGAIHAFQTDISLSNSIIYNSFTGYPPEWNIINGAAIYALECPHVSVDNTLMNFCFVDEKGGGIYAENCPDISINNSTFYHLDAGHYGGGIYLKNSIVEIDSCWFEYMRLDFSGITGITIYMENTIADITRCILVRNDNDAQSTSAVVTMTDSCQVTFDHSDICYNIGWSGHAFHLIDDNSTLNISNSIFYDIDSFVLQPISGTLNMSYSIAPTIWPGVGNLFGDPLITNACLLTSSSPCIDAGDPNYPLDPDSTRSDMGAFYYESGGAVSGPISGVWTAENSPYLIGNNAYIPAGDTLRMLPGTVVEFTGSYTLNVCGTLLIEGEADDSVSIYGVIWPSLSQLYFSSTQTQSHLQYGYFNDFGINMGPMPTIIHRCQLNHCPINAAISSGNVLTESTLDNDAHRMELITGGSDWTMIGNYLDNDYSAFYEPAVTMGICSASGTFIANTIHCSASSSGGEWCYAIAKGFLNCEGTFAHNYVSVYAIGGFYSSDQDAAFDECSGTCRHNCISAHDYGIYNFSGELFNNTIRNASYGIKNYNGTVRNSIFYNCSTYGIDGTCVVRYSSAFDCGSPYSSSVTVGPGNIYEDPLLVNTWYLDPNSPCIDAGDPDPFYNDPDGTRDDMGANYFDQGAAFATIALNPYGAPIQIPANGGSFDFNIEIQNNGVNQVTGNVWCNVVLPNGTLSGPLLGPTNLTLPGGFIGDRDRTQTVPAAAPEGEYIYRGLLGLYPDTIWDMDTFVFEKLPTGEGMPVEGWLNTGEPFEEWIINRESAALPKSYALEPAYPNPFNPTTTISYALPSASPVRLTVYDLQGRTVAKLVDGMRDAGVHEVTWDAMGFASGIYFCRIEAGEFEAVRKLMLVK